MNRQIRCIPVGSGREPPDPAAGGRPDGAATCCCSRALNYWQVGRTEELAVATRATPAP